LLRGEAEASSRLKRFSKASYGRSSAATPQRTSGRPQRCSPRARFRSAATRNGKLGACGRVRPDRSPFTQAPMRALSESLAKSQLVGFMQHDQKDTPPLRPVAGFSLRCFSAAPSQIHVKASVSVIYCSELFRDCGRSERGRNWIRAAHPPYQFNERGSDRMGSRSGSTFA